MNNFNELLEIFDKLLGPNGCEWDKKQTFASIRIYLLEEVYELFDAIDQNDYQSILDELGDILNSTIFIAKLAEKSKKFYLEDVIKNLSNKLIRRHPHVFGGLDVKNVDEIVDNWDKIKKKEKLLSKRKSALDGISKKLPGLLKAQKIIGKAKKSKFSLPKHEKISSNEELGKKLLAITMAAEDKGFNAENALRKALTKLESDFRKWEKKNTGDVPKA